MISIYLYEKCSTCQKALRFLDSNRIPYNKLSIVDNPPSKEELLLMLDLQQNNLKKLFNTSGLLYKSLRLKETWNDYTKEALIDLLAKNGMLIKRPFVLSSSIGLLGFDETSWNNILNF